MTKTATTTETGTEHVLLKCVACQHEQPETNKFCPACGEVVTKAVSTEDYNAVLKAVTTAANAPIPAADTVVLKGVTGADGTETPTPLDSALSLIIKSKLPEGVDALDAGPIIKAQHGATVELATGMRELLGHNGRLSAQNVVLMTNNGLLLKAVGMLMHKLGSVGVDTKSLADEVKVLKGTIDDFGNQRRGRQSAITTVTKSVSTDVADAAKGGNDPEREPMAADLVLKAQTIMETNPGCISALDIGALMVHADERVSVAMLRAMDPSLCARIDKAFASAPSH